MVDLPSETDLGVGHAWIGPLASTSHHLTAKARQGRHCCVTLAGRAQFTAKYAPRSAKLCTPCPDDLLTHFATPCGEKRRLRETATQLSQTQRRYRGQDKHQPTKRCYQVHIVRTPRHLLV